jgi:hypothetical protein
MLLIRPAAPSDVPLLLRCFRELAEYQRQPHAVVVEEMSRYGRRATREGAPSRVKSQAAVQLVDSGCIHLCGQWQ